MPVHVAFLRAVNVGTRQVRMSELREVLTGAGFDEVETHIQTGNVKVRTSTRSTAKVGAELARVIGAWKGFEVPCIVRTPAQLTALVAAVDDVEALLEPAGRRYVALAGGVVFGDEAHQARGDAQIEEREVGEDGLDDAPDAVASIAERATTVAISRRPAGRPVRGSITWPARPSASST